MGMLYRRGCIWWVKYYRNGKCFRESSKSKSRSDGKQLLRKREGEITTGVFLGLETERVRFEELAQDLLNEYQTNNRKSLVWLKRRINLHLMPFFGGCRTVDVTTERVRAYIIHRQQEGFTGARESEILNLKWEQVDLERYTAHFEPGSTKNDQPRTIPLTGELLETLRIQKAACDSRFPECDYVFHRKGQRIGNFQRAWKSACKRAGVSGRLFHDLRRSAVRNFIRAGVPERVAMAISGHKTRSVFDRYNIVAERDLHEAAGRLEKHLADCAPVTKAPEP